MVKAVVKDQIIAKSEETVVVEGNHYFPPGDVDDGVLVPSEHTSTCPWKGEASYYHVQVGDQVNENAAWTYPAPKDAAAEIEDHIAFWKGVEVTE